MITAIVFVKADVARIPEVAEAIAALDGVSEVYSVTGQIDLIAHGAGARPRRRGHGGRRAAQQGRRRRSAPRPTSRSAPTPSTTSSRRSPSASTENQSPRTSRWSASAASREVAALVVSRADTQPAILSSCSGSRRDAVIRAACQARATIGPAIAAATRPRSCSTGRASTSMVTTTARTQLTTTLPCAETASSARLEIVAIESSVALTTKPAACHPLTSKPGPNARAGPGARRRTQHAANAPPTTMHQSQARRPGRSARRGSRGSLEGSADADP